MAEYKRKLSRRSFLKRSAAVAGAAGAGSYLLGCGSGGGSSRSGGKKVIIIGIDGMDPLLAESMMKEGLLPNLSRMRAAGGFSKLGTSCPPQSPVAWANFINGAGPGSHGIFDFIHRHPHEQCSKPFFSAAETIPGEGHMDVGQHRLHLDFWPFNHKPPATVLRRQGEPFWDFLDAAHIPSTFYDLPCNYPPSPSQHGHHRCLSGMGTPDMLGTYGTYQHFAENNPPDPVDEEGGKRSRLIFEDETARAVLYGPANSFVRGDHPPPVTVEFLVHRDRDANAAVIEIQGRRILLKAGDWSRWLKVTFQLTGPAFISKDVTGICRFYVQEVSPNFRLYATPVNIDPGDPAVQISEPPDFVQDLSKKLGPFYTAGFQEDHKARSNGVFADDEFIKQATMVLDERLALLEHAVQNYDDGLLFFYFSSSDLQSHMLWWNSDAEHPTRTADEARGFFGHVRRLYQKLDAAIGSVADRYGSQATIIVMSDHGFANFGRQFNLNTWLRNMGYLGPPECKSIMREAGEDGVDWSRTVAYGLGINGLYLNLKGREKHGIVEPGEMREALLTELVTRLEAVTDTDGQRVIRGVYRADRVYSGNATALAPDLIVGYTRNYRASWSTILGDLTDDVLLDNDSAWSADHCCDALEVPGLIFTNKPMRSKNPSLVDVSPSILAEFGLPTPASMVGRNIFAT